MINRKPDSVVAVSVSEPTPGSMLTLLLAHARCYVAVMSVEELKGRSHRHNLSRLNPSVYRGLAYVHWIFNIRDRKRGWLNVESFLRFQLLATHAFLRQHIAAPCVCLMPDHIHMLLIGYNEHRSDQRVAVEFLRKQMKPYLAKGGFELQRPPYDHVLRQEERNRDAFANTSGYILGNPVRAGLISEGENPWPFECAVVPGYPDLDIRAEDYWDKFWRIYHEKLLATD